MTVGPGEDEGAHYCGAVARSLCGGSPSRPLVATKMKGRTTAGRWYAPCAAVRLLRTRRPARQLYDLWDQAPVSYDGYPGVHWGRLLATLRGGSGGVCL
jgi:hypothetical protein